jgi:Domain of unknown function DUF29
MSLTHYNHDIIAWANEQARYIRNKQFDLLDLEHIAEEIEDVGKSEQRELASRIVVLLCHLLKWYYKPNKRSISWFTTIANQRDDLTDLLKDNPGLKQYLPELLKKSYRNARREAAAETGLVLSNFPDQCPYSLPQILDPGFLCNTTSDFKYAMDQDTANEE